MEPRRAHHDEFMSVAQHLMERWERRQSQTRPVQEYDLDIPAERECLPCLLEEAE